MQLKKKNMGVNAVLNVIKQMLSVLFPLITYPYALRILGAENIGKVSYGSSIISYFSLIAALGVTSYAIREGAKRKNNRVEFAKFSNEIFTVNMIFTVLAYVLLAITIIFVGKLKDYRLLLIIQSSSIILTTIGVDWINTIYEDFLYITVRSIFAHILSMLILFLFVHTPDDYYIYALLSISTLGLTCITNWFYCRKYVHIKLTRHPHIRQHIKPLLYLFANTIAISVYTNSDTTMLGWIKGDYDVGIYSVAVKLYNIVKNILVAVYAVTIPRLSFYYGQAKESEFKTTYTKMWGYLSLLLIPAGIGLVCISREAMLFLGGEEYLDGTLALQLLSIALIFAIFGGLVTACLNVTIGREKENLGATIISAIINVVLNLVLISKFSYNATAFTTLISEAFVFLYCFIRIPEKEKYLDIKLAIKTILHAVLASVWIVIVTMVMRYLIEADILRMMIIILCSVVLYGITLLAIRDKYVIEFLNIFASRIKRK